jgi:hypothetical protein
MKATGERAKAGGTGRNQSQTSKQSTTAKNLTDLGITRDQSHRWQLMSTVPKAERSAGITEHQRQAAHVAACRRRQPQAGNGRGPDRLTSSDSSGAGEWGISGGIENPRSAGTKARQGSRRPGGFPPPPPSLRSDRAR